MQSELAPAALAVAGVGHTVADEVDEFAGLEQPLRLRAAADALAVDEHARYLHAHTTQSQHRPSYNSSPHAIRRVTTRHYHVECFTDGHSQRQRKTSRLAVLR